MGKGVFDKDFKSGIKKDFKSEIKEALMKTINLTSFY